MRKFAHLIGLGALAASQGKFWRAGCAITFLCLQTCVSHATPLAPGGSIIASGEPDPVGAVLLSTITLPFSSPSFSGSVISCVYSNDTSSPFGLMDLTFTYEIIVTNGPDAISAASFGAFTGFQTDVSYQSPPTIGPGLPPANISRNPTGSQAVKFDFTGNGYLNPSTNSALLVVQTDATAWHVGSATILDDIGVANVGVLTPIEVPEPASIGLVGFGLAALAGYRCWKRKRTGPAT